MCLQRQEVNWVKFIHEKNLQSSFLVWGYTQLGLWAVGLGVVPRSQRAAPLGLQAQEEGTCSSGSREKEAEKIPDRMKAAGRG